MDFDVTQILDRHADVIGPKPALIDPAGRWSFAELSTAARDFECALRNLGVRPGARVGLMMDGTREHVALVLAVLRIGAAAVPLNSRLTAPELATFLANCGPALVLTTPPYLDRATGIAPRCVLEGGRLVRADPVATPDDRRREGGSHPEGIIIGTGGTTGIPKGAVYSPAAVWFWAIGCAFGQQLRADDVELFGSPFFHSTLLTGLLTPLVAGATVCIPERFDVEHVVQAVAEHGVTRIGGAPTMISRILDVARADPENWRGIRTIQFGSTKSPPGFVPAVRAAFPGASLITGYGSTEFGPVTRCYTGDFEIEGGAGVGRPVPAASVAIVDPETGLETRRPDVQGEVAVRSPWQMSYYTGPIEATEDVLLPSGAIRSGDIGHFDHNGYLHLDGRSKDIIITGGENVFPAEVEFALGEFPNITELAVYGVADPVWGERIELAISVADGAAAPTLTEIREYGRHRLAPYKLPRSLAVVEELPLTSNNKLDKRRLATATELPREIWPERSAADA